MSNGVEEDRFTAEVGARGTVFGIFDHDLGANPEDVVSLSTDFNLVIDPGILLGLNRNGMRETLLSEKYAIGVSVNKGQYEVLHQANMAMVEQMVLQEDHDYQPGANQAIVDGLGRLLGSLNTLPGEFSKHYEKAMFERLIVPALSSVADIEDNTACTKIVKMVNNLIERKKERQSI